MFRLVALLLALLMPLQFVWGAAAAYCGHEPSSGSTHGAMAQAAQHFGHHEHVHQADAKKAADTKPMGDNDCGTCHAGCSVMTSDPVGAAGLLPAARRFVLPPASSPASALTRAPDRPQWLRLA
ncbi:MAG: cation efflux protein, CzcI family [Leptothrix sp. (in: b-proteobacteria)]